MASISAAGVLPRSQYNGSDYYYFGVTSGKKEITTFCGRKNPGEKNRKCAAREFMEESLGAITSEDKIKKILKVLKNVTRIENRAVKQVTYITPLKIKGNPMAIFNKKRNAPGLKAHQKEIKEIVAIKVSDLISQVRANNRIYKGHAFRGDAWGTLQLALKNNQL